MADLITPQEILEELLRSECTCEPEGVWRWECQPCQVVLHHRNLNDLTDSARIHCGTWHYTEMVARVARVTAHKE